MSSKKQSFLALDVGTGRVRAFGFMQNGAEAKTHLYTASGSDLAANIINAIDAVEEKLGCRFGSAHITGNFGPVRSVIGKNSLSWERPHKMTDADAANAIANSEDLAEPESGETLHLIPLKFLIDREYNVKSVENITGQTLSVKFNSISYPDGKIGEIKDALHGASVPPARFYDPIYLLGQAYQNGKKPAILIDFGETATRVGVKTERGLIGRFNIPLGQRDITKRLAESFNIDFAEAEKIKLSALAAPPSPADAYIMAADDITVADVRDAWSEVNGQIADEILSKIKLGDHEIFITGAGENPDNIKRLILEGKNLPDITVLNEYAACRAFGNIFRMSPGAAKARPVKVRILRNIPIIPSVMCWNINDGNIYKMFANAGIRRLHVDVMDGFYTDKVLGGLDEIKRIRAKTNLALHVHLMVDDPALWADIVLRAGADMIILSSGSRNIGRTLKEIARAGKTSGLALAPDFNLKKLSPEILSIVDEIVVMGVKPGASGQQFIPETAGKVKIISATKRKYGFKYKIAVDGGINDKTAKICWAAGADHLISGSYLKNAPDFTNAVLGLMEK